MRKLMLLALASCFLALPVMAAAQGHGHAGGGAPKTNNDVHGDMVSGAAKNAKANPDGDKVGTDVRGVAHDKAKGKGLTKTHGKGH